MAWSTAVSKYLAEIGRMGGKASGKARMEKLTPEQRTAVARTAAAARWAKPVTQADLQVQSALQVAEWTADRAAQMGAEEINVRLADGAALKPGKLTFNKKLKMATVARKATARPAVPTVAANKPRRREGRATNHEEELARSDGPKASVVRRVCPKKQISANTSTLERTR